MANQTKETDVLIVGAGIAGLSLALYLAEQSQKHQIVVLAKGSLEVCNTAMAKGGIAAVQNFAQDSFEQHIADTFAAGQQKGEKAVIEEVVRTIPQRIKDLMRWGVTFDCNGKAFDLHQEGGHLYQRILHHADYTGKEVHSKLLLAAQQKANIRFLQNSMGIDFFVKDGKINGLKIIDEQQQLLVLGAKVFVLATGGGGQLFAHTTNSKIATADGVAMASRIGASIKDLQYFQFHPTALYKKGSQRLDLLTEALRGFGAQLVDEAGKRFMFAYDAAGELANRTVVSQAIFEELKKSKGEYLYLKLIHLNQKALQEKFPSAYKSCLNAGYDPANELIPIVPAAHYQCGGISVDRLGKTDFKNLYAIGECACTKLHGANRLASNSLSEALVYAQKASQSIAAVLKQTKAEKAPKIELAKETLKCNLTIEKELQLIQNELSKIHRGFDTMTDFASTAHKLSILKASLNQANLQMDKKVAEFRNIVEVALLYVKAKKQQTIAENMKKSTAVDLADAFERG